MSLLKSLSIEHYKWFFEEQTLEFWIPDQQNNWSWLTVITGPNNTGKTSIIEALLIWENNKKFYDEDCHPNTSPKIKFLQNDDNEVVFTNINNWSIIKKIWKKTTSIATVLSRRYRNPEFNWNRDENSYFEQILWKPNIRDNSTHELIPMLKILESTWRRIQFDNILKSVLPNINNRTIWTNKHWDYIKYTTWWWDIHTTSSLWDGILSVFVICAALSSWEFDRHMIIIDEPELSLHPQAQKRLAKVLSEESKRRQVIICTHSPYFVNWKDLINWAKFVRLNKINDSKCTIHCLWNCSNYTITEKTIHDWHKPFTLEDIAAKEIMFSEKILFVEGQEDVWLIKKYCDWNLELNFDIFWFWAWGWWRFEAFLRMSKDLGIEKVWVLYDNWKDTINDYNKQREEYKNYHFEILETDDIRDKPNEWKKWIFNEKWKINPEYKNHFDWILQNFINYFK